MTPDIEKIEHLLNAKTFGDLTAAERELVMAHLSGAAEYEHMRETLVRVKKVFVTEAATLTADADLKEQILGRFEQNRPKHPSLAERIATFFQTLIPSPAGRFAGALAALLLVVSVGFFMWPKQQAEMAQQLLPPASEPQIVTLTDNTEPVTTAVTQAVREEAAPVDEITFKTTVTDGSGSTWAWTPMDASYGDGVPPAEMDAEKKEAIGQSGVTEDLKTAAPGDAQFKITDQQPPVYMNQEGLMQYQNSRVADVGKLDNTYSDAYKNYTEPQNKKESRNNYEKSRVPMGSVSTQPSPDRNQNRVDKDVTVRAKTQTLETETKQKAAEEESKALLEQVVVSAPTFMPVWPRVEGQSNPYAATVESLKAFFSKETGSAYHTGNYRNTQKSRVAKLTLTFDSKGVITKVHVSGDVNEAQKKAIIQRALQLPTFHFTNGAGMPVLEQTYRLELY